MLFILATSVWTTAMKNCFKIILFVCLLFNGYTSQAQSKYADFREQEDLNIKSEMGLELWNYYLRHSLDSLKMAAVDLLLDASEKKHEFARAAGTRMLGSYLYRSGKIEQGLEYLIVAKSFFEKKEDYMIASEINNEIGHVYLLKGDYAAAKKAYNESLKFGELSPDETATFNGKLGLGKVYVAMGDTNTGMTLIHSYKQLALQNQKFEAVSDAFAYMAMVENDRGNEDLSQEYYLRSIQFSKRSKSKIHLSHSYANMGILKFGMEDYDSSLYYFKESLRLRKEMSAIRPIIEGYYNLGFFYMERDSIRTAIENFNSGLQLARRYEFMVDEVDLLNELIAIYTEKNDTAMVAKYTERVEELKAILSQQEKDDAAALDGIDLDFNKAPDKKESPDGLNWVGFTIVVVGIALLIFFYLERRRTS